MQQGYNLRKVDQVNLFTVVCLVLIICVQVVIGEGLKEAFLPLIAGTSVIVIMLIAYFLRINNYLRGQIYAGLTALVVAGLMLHRYMI